jgi:hypothetical protein
MIIVASRPRIGVLGLAALLLASTPGCAYRAKHHYETRPPPFGECTGPDGGAGETLVGVAMSGGGSRAAVFSAAGMEALREHGISDQISHVSSVSGGSIASSYYVTQRGDCDAAPDPEACWREFFAGYQKNMRKAYTWRMVGYQLAKFRFLSNSRAASSLQDALDGALLDGLTFGDLRERAQVEGRALERPVLIINAATYDEARRFAFTNLCFSEPGEVEPKASERWPQNLYDPRSISALRSATFSRPGCDRAVPTDVPVSLAVATSAAFPPSSATSPSPCRAGVPPLSHRTGRLDAPKASTR